MPTVRHDILRYVSSSADRPQVLARGPEKPQCFKESSETFLQATSVPIGMVSVKSVRRSPGRHTGSPKVSVFPHAPRTLPGRLPRHYFALALHPCYLQNSSLFIMVVCYASLVVVSIFGIGRYEYVRLIASLAVNSHLLTVAGISRTTGA